MYLRQTRQHATSFCQLQETKRYTLVDDSDAVIHLYTIMFNDTVQIAKMYGVSSSAVQEFLSRRGYTRERRKQEIIQFILNLCEANCTNDLKLLMPEINAVYPTLTLTQVNNFFKRNKRILKQYCKTDVDSHAILDLWKNGYNVTEIANSLNIEKLVVRKVCTNSDIPANKDKRLIHLYGHEYIVELYQRLGSRSAAKELNGNYTHFDIVNVVKDAGIQIGISASVKRRLKSKRWCIAAYNKYKSYKLIANTLLNDSAGPDTVAHYCQVVHGIEKNTREHEFPVLLCSDQLESMYKGKSVTQLASDIGCSPWILSDTLKQYGIEQSSDFQTSTGEKEVADYVASLGFKPVLNDRKIIAPKELDIVIPELNIAIEYCGVYYHSSKFKTSEYHLTKMKLANAAGYRLITLFESEWTSKQSVVKAKLAAILGKTSQPRIYARTTTPKHISYADASKFLNEHHIQGTTKASIRIGLYYGDQLVACMMFVRKKNYTELVRYATSASVVGGFGKLFKFYINNYNNDQDVVSFADLRWTNINSNVYAVCNFVCDKIYTAGFSWVDRHGVHRREKYMKCKQEDILTTYNSELTEEQNCAANGIYKLYDCGKARYRWTS